MVANDDPMGQDRRLPGECEGPWTTGRYGKVCRWATWCYRGTNTNTKVLHVHYAVMNTTYILKTAVNTNSRASSVVTALLAGGPSPALLLGNTRQV